MGHQWDENNSACLFDWDDDKHIFTNGSSLSFRYRKEPVAEPLAGIPSRKWKEFITEYYRNRASMSLGIKARPRTLRYFFLFGAPVIAIGLWFLRFHYCKGLF